VGGRLGFIGQRLVKAVFVILGIIVLGEAATPMRIASALLILAGMIGLKLASDA
jgi:multidrug transporter EmrE-like cation transporter